MVYNNCGFTCYYEVDFQLGILYFFQHYDTTDLTFHVFYNYLSYFGFAVREFPSDNVVKPLMFIVNPVTNLTAGHKSSKIDICYMIFVKLPKALLIAALRCFFYKDLYLFIYFLQV